jgi:predicted Zn-dependent protease
LDEVARKLAKSSDRPDLEYHFSVLDSADISTFTLAGNYIYICRGIATGVPNSIAS